jgi:hypothetical protein
LIEYRVPDGRHADVDYARTAQCGGGGSRVQFRLEAARASVSACVSGVDDNPAGSTKPRI